MQRIRGRLAQAQPARSAEWSQTTPSQYELPVWYFTSEEERAAAQAEVEAALADLQAKQGELDTLTTDEAYAGLLEAESRLAETRTAFDTARLLLERANRQSDTALRPAAQDAYDITISELEGAQEAYADLMNSDEAADLLAARAALIVAQERYDTAIDRSNALLTGADSLRVQVAAAALSQAQANLAQAETKINQAQTAIDQAQAQLDLLDVQMSKLEVSAAVNGVVLSRNIEPGEVVPAGAVALTLAQLDRLTITVYLPEDRYGEVDLGDEALVSVDSFPNQVFQATVSRIADEAEFTPRNVATDEGRRSTVFAVELTVADPAGQLRPGISPGDESCSTVARLAAAAQGPGRGFSLSPPLDRLGCAGKSLLRCPAGPGKDPRAGDCPGV